MLYPVRVRSRDSKTCPLRCACVSPRVGRLKPFSRWLFCSYRRERVCRAALIDKRQTAMPAVWTQSFRAGEDRRSERPGRRRGRREPRWRCHRRSRLPSQWTQASDSGERTPRRRGPGGSGLRITSVVAMRRGNRRHRFRTTHGLLDPELVDECSEFRVELNVADAGRDDDDRTHIHQRNPRREPGDHAVDLRPARGRAG